MNLIKVLMDIIKIISAVGFLVVLFCNSYKKDGRPIIYKYFDKYDNLTKDLIEDDLDKNFVVMQRVDTPKMFVYKRLAKASLIYFLSQFLLLVILQHLIVVVIAPVFATYYFKQDYIAFKAKVQKRIEEVDREFVRYFKTLQMLMQNYSINTALEKSLIYAPPKFNNQLRELLLRLASGRDDFTVYQEFANLYNSSNIDALMSLVYNLSRLNEKQKILDLNTYGSEISQVSHQVRQIKYKERLSRIQIYGFIPPLIYVVIFVILVFTSVFMIF